MQIGGREVVRAGRHRDRHDVQRRRPTILATGHGPWLIEDELMPAHARPTANSADRFDHCLHAQDLLLVRATRRERDSRTLSARPGSHRLGVQKGEPLARSYRPFDCSRRRGRLRLSPRRGLQERSLPDLGQPVRFDGLRRAARLSAVALSAQFLRCRTRCPRIRSHLCRGPDRRRPGPPSRPSRTVRTHATAGPPECPVR
jgi:hypothetical protein